MKETVNVSIAGISFILDRECYAMLSNYLSQTEVSLRSNPNSGEILADIEARIAEQILSVQSAEHPVPVKVMTPIIEQLGGNVSFESASESYSSTSTTKPLARRLYRNREGSVLGGVCTGLATYFNISVILVRILFLLPIIARCFSVIWKWGFINDNGFHIWYINPFGGTAFLVYVILWIVIPQAKTPRQRLEMQGENVTVNAITNEKSTTVRQVSDNSAATNVIVSILKIFAMVVGSLLFFGVLAGLLMGFAHLSIGIHQGLTQIPEALEVMNISYFWACMLIAGIVMIPLLSIMYLIFSGVMNFKPSKIITGLFTLLWVGLLVFAFVLVMSNIGELSAINWDNNVSWEWHWHNNHWD